MASPHSPTTSGGDFDTDLLPLSSNGRAGSEYDSQNEAEEDRNLFIDEEIVADAAGEEEDDDGEDLYPDNFMEQYVSSQRYSM
jgi:DNA replication licensing factor MCM2